MGTSNRVTLLTLREGVKDDWSLCRQSGGISFQEEETTLQKAWRQSEAQSSEAVGRKPRKAEGCEEEAEDGSREQGAELRTVR